MWKDIEQLLCRVGVFHTEDSLGGDFHGFCANCEHRSGWQGTAWVWTSDRMWKKRFCFYFVLFLVERQVLHTFNLFCLGIGDMIVSLNPMDLFRFVVLFGSCFMWYKIHLQKSSQSVTCQSVWSYIHTGLQDACLRTCKAYGVQKQAMHGGVFFFLFLLFTTACPLSTVGVKC